MLFADALEKILRGDSLGEDESYFVMKEILEGKLAPAQIAGLLTALRAKGETAEEVVGFVKAMRGSMVRLETHRTVVVDTCGTGGDGTHTFNISTAAALVAAGAGAAVAKHGNRSVSSKSGSADVFEALGVKIDMGRKAAERCLDEIGITFLFAPLYHPAMRNVAPIRKELGIRTVFNLIGPLSNPACANAQVIGVPKKEFMALIGQALKKLSAEKSQTALVVSEQGHDEMILAGSCSVRQVLNGKMKSYTLTPSRLGLSKVPAETLRGGSAEDNARLLQKVLRNENLPVKEVVIANAALALYAAELASKNAKANLTLCAVRARQSIESGAALKKLEELVQWSHRGE